MLNAKTRSRLGDLLPRLGSDSDGEVVATARAIGRILAASGADWYDVVTALSKPLPQRTKPAEWREMVAACIERELWRTEWEREFLYGLLRWRGDLSEKQRTILERIFHEEP